MRHQSRKKTNVVSSALFAIGIHAAIVGLLFTSFQWQHKQSRQVTSVTLWDQLPQPKNKPEPVKAPPPEPEIKPPEPEPKPEPEQKVEKPPAPKGPTEAEIALEKKKKKEALEKKKREAEKKRKKEAERKKREKLKKLKQALLKEEQAKQDAAIKRLQEQALADEQAERDAKAQAAMAAVNASIVDQYVSKIEAKIRGYVNRSVCGDGNPTVVIKVGLLPTGQLSGSPSLSKSSGIQACDDAVLRAVLAAEPLPLPEERALFNQFRNLKLNFKPNE